MTENDVAQPMPRHLSSLSESALFWRLRKRLARRTVAQALSETRLRTLTVLVLSAVLWGILYIGFAEGFQLLNMMISHVGTRMQTVHAVYNVFFVTLFGMMTISSGVIIYSTLYRSREVRFLLTTPTSVRRIVLYKFQETVLFAGWGLLLLGTPLLIAFGRQNGASLLYYVCLIPFLTSFIVLPVGLGTIGCLLIVRFMPQMRMHAVMGTAAIALLAILYLAYLVLRPTAAIDLLTPEWFYSTLAQLRYSEQRLLPSWWLSTGLLEAATASSVRPFCESLGFFSTLASNAVLAYLLVGWAGARWFLPGFSTLSGLNRTRSHAQQGRLDRLIGYLLRPLPKRLRPMLAKDVLIFRRDPIQWSQVLVFFALLTIYFVQTRRVYYGKALTNWVVMISFLNLSVIGFMLATFTTRFIYPLISLEGRRIWILATAPVTRDAVIWGKFVLGITIALVPCTFLTVMSDMMLRLHTELPWVIPLHLLVCVALCSGLSAFAVGLGARFPDLKENSPAKIATGFGGTLTLIVSALYVVGLVLITALPTYFVLKSPEAGASDVRGLEHPFWVLGGAVAVTVVVAIVSTVAPMRIGASAFRKLEL